MSTFVIFDNFLQQDITIEQAAFKAVLKVAVAIEVEQSLAKQQQYTKIPVFLQEVKSYVLLL